MNPVQFASFSAVDAVQKTQRKPAFAASFPLDQVRFAGKTGTDKAREYVDQFKERGVAVAGGGGTMGSAIASNYLNNDVPVYLLDKEQRFVDNGKNNIEKEFTGAVGRGIFTEAEAAEKAGRLRGTFAVDDGGIQQMPKNVGLAIEAVFENPAVKADLFRQMDAHFDKDTIIATNTSSLSVDDLAQSVSPERRKNFVGIHYFLPANKNRFIEVIKGKDTSAETVERSVALVKALGKTPIVCEKDSPGFVVNRMLVPVMNEGIRVYDRMVNDALAEEFSGGFEDHRADRPRNAGARLLPAGHPRRTEIEARVAANIEQAVKEVLWPTYSKKPEAQGMLIGPFSGLNNPVYMGLIGEIAKIMHEKLGDGYSPADSIVMKSAEFRQLGRGATPEQIEALKFKIGGPETIDRELVEKLKKHFQGLVFGVATQLVDEGVASPADINKGVMLGTQWELSPFEAINKMGTDRALELVEAYRETNPDFKLPQVLVDKAVGMPISIEQAMATRGYGWYRMGAEPFKIEYVKTRVDGNVGFVTIDKLQRNNALDRNMLDQLEAAFDKMNNDPAVKTIVFESVGGKHFVSGADIFALMDQVNAIKADVKKSKLPGFLKGPVLMAKQYAAIYPFLRKGDTLYDKIAASPKSTVAKVTGTALGGGTELALACDYVVTDENAVFGLPEVKYGIFPAWGGTERLAAKIGKPLAKWMILNGGKMDNKGKGEAILSGAEATMVGIADMYATSGEIDTLVADRAQRGLFPKQKPAGQPPLASFSDAPRAYASTRFPAIEERYATASTEELLESDLKGLYKPAVLLAALRVDRGEKPGRLTQERELLAMAQNMAGAEAQQRKAAKG